MISFLPSVVIPRATSTGRLSAPAPVLRLSTTPSSINTRYWSLSRRRWKAATAASSDLATRLTVCGLTGRPSIPGFNPIGAKISLRCGIICDSRMG